MKGLTPAVTSDIRKTLKLENDAAPDEPFTNVVTFICWVRQ